MINQLKKQRLTISIDEKNIIAPNIKKIYREAMEYIDFNKLKRVRNDINTITDTLIKV